MRDERPRFEPNGDAEARLTGAFASAMTTGDVNAFASLLAEDAVLYTDGGGKRSAALNPIFGRERIVRFFQGAARKGWIPSDARPARINGLPGFVATMSDGVETIALEITAIGSSGCIRAAIRTSSGTWRSRRSRRAPPYPAGPTAAQAQRAF